MSESSEAAVPPPPPRAKRQMTPAQLENLARAREKAAEKRRQIGEIAQASKAKKEADFQAALAKARADKAALGDSSKPAAPAARAKPTRKKPVAATQSSSEDDDTEDEPSPPPPKRTRAPKKTWPSPPAGQSLADAATVARGRLQRQVDGEMLRYALGSIFPGMI